jgi:hypothetical protein
MAKNTMGDDELVSFAANSFNHSEKKKQPTKDFFFFSKHAQKVKVHPSACQNYGNAKTMEIIISQNRRLNLF